MKQYGILICTYNGASRLSATLNAVLACRRIEEMVDKIVVVDNSSTDNTAEVIKEFVRLYPSLIEYEYEEKQGLTYARQHFVSLRSEWVIFLDDDNLVDSEWLVEMDDYLNSHCNVGIANSACIAIPQGFFSDNDLDMLYAVCPAIACTHFSQEDYFNKKKSMIKFPFGAGMFVRKKPLNDFISDGWTNNIGRKGAELLSGEDGEIAEYVIKKGYEYGLNEKCYIMHLIPHRRIENDYIEKLSLGLTIGYVNALKKKKHYHFLKIIVILRNSLLIIVSKVISLFVRNKRRKIQIRLSVKTRIETNKRLLKR